MMPKTSYRIDRSSLNPTRALKSFRPRRCRAPVSILDALWDKYKALLTSAPSKAVPQISYGRRRGIARKRHTAQHWPTSASPVRRWIIWSISWGGSACCLSVWPSFISLPYLGDLW